jgi:hypothetical protein
MTTTLVVLGLDRYGAEAVHFQPETWLRDVYDDCRVKLADGTLSRLMAGCAILREPHRFYAEAPTFEFLCRMLNSAPGVRPHYGELADIEDVAWGLVEGVALHPPDHGFSPAVETYVRVAARYAGLERLPRVLGGLGLTYEAPADPDSGRTNLVAVAHARGRAQALAAVESHVAENAAVLAAQLRALHLRHGDAAAFAAKLDRLAGSGVPAHA